MTELDFSESVGLDNTLGIRYISVEKDLVVARMEITPSHLQPVGYLHGGASIVLAESVASVGATVSSPDGQVAFGMEINANHLRPKQDGWLEATATPLHKGKTSHVWEVNIRDERDKLICVSRCTLAIVEPRNKPSTKTEVPE